MGEFANTLGELYDTYGPGQVYMSEDSDYYMYRRDMHSDAYEGDAYFEVNGNVPYSGICGIPEGIYNSELSSGRATLGTAVVTEVLGFDASREELPDPPGFVQADYQGVTPYGALYEKVQLVPGMFGGGSGLENLVTGTEYLSYNLRQCWAEIAGHVDDMDDGCGVCLRVTPVYSGVDSVCAGILVEAESYGTDAVRMCRYYYNVQPGVRIDYMSGESCLDAVPEIVQTEDDANGS